jgi:transposase-like protein
MRFGHLRSGKQRYRCHACGRTFCDNPTPRQTDPVRKEQILAAYQERCSMRGVARVFGVSRNTLAGWLKKTHEPASSAKHLASLRREGDTRT